jgi:hypothetical protein
MTLADAVSAAYDWATRPAAGWHEFLDARARFLETLAGESELSRLEALWRMVPADAPPPSTR